jgi:DNA-binding CsgD family transcriptional regulator
VKGEDCTCAAHRRLAGPAALPEPFLSQAANLIGSAKSHSGDTNAGSIESLPPRQAHAGRSRLGVPRRAARDCAIDGSALADAYAVLVDEPDLDESCLASRLQCSEETARTIVDRLADLALVHQRGSRATGRVAVSPIAAMHRLIVRERDMLAQRERSLLQSADMFSSILSAYGLSAAYSHQHQFGEHVPDMPTLRLRLEQLVARASHAVCAISTGPNDPLAEGVVASSLDQLAVAAGVKVRRIYPDSIWFDSDALKHVHAAADAGVEIRLAARSPLAMMVVDAQTAVIPATSASQREGGLVIQQETILSAMLALFATCWDQSQPLAGMEADPLSAAEVAILKLLATGAKDDAIARQLGTSVRTIRRIVGNLMRRAGVSSRFAFGVWAAATVGAHG